MVKNVIPSSYQEALKILASGKYRIINGGTDMMVRHRNWAETPPKFKQDILHIHNLSELNDISEEEDILRIGGAVTLDRLLAHPKTPGVMKECLRLFASPAIRNVATLAGNLANASPAGDLILILYLLDARIVIESLGEKKILPVDKVVTGPSKTVLMPEEIIKAIDIPIGVAKQTYFVKVGGRRADAISKVSFAAVYSFDSDVLKDIRMTLGAVNVTVIRDKAFEQTLIGLSKKALMTRKPDILKHYEPLIRPIDDQRSNKRYRKRVALNLIGDFITRIGG